MISNDRFTIYPTATFKEEFSNIIDYIKYNLKEPLTANKFYQTILEKISTLDFMPERYSKILGHTNKSKNLRSLIVYNYIIVYEVVHNTRSSFHFTYIS